MKKVIFIIIAFCSIQMLGCTKSNELTPKTSGLNVEYLLPRGVLLTNEEREVINQRMEEYHEATD